MLSSKKSVEKSKFGDEVPRSRVAIILIGEDKDSDVSLAAAALKVAKEERDPLVEVRIIDAFNCQKEDFEFLYSRSLSEIAVMGHSSAFSADGNTFLPMEERQIGALSADSVGKILRVLARCTTASRYTFYPCEMGDKVVRQGSEWVELRDALRPLTSPMHPETESDEVVGAPAHSSQSTLDLMRSYIKRGLAKNPRLGSETMVRVEGQVGPGDPSRASDLASPRGSIRREAVRPIIEALKPTATARDKQRASKAEALSKKRASETNWDIQTIRDLELGDGERFTFRSTIELFKQRYTHCISKCMEAHERRPDETDSHGITRR